MEKENNETNEFKIQLKLIFEKIQEYRLLTINVIEYILRWREFMTTPFLMISKTDSRKITNYITLPFVYENQNYILKVRKVIKFTFNFLKAKNRHPLYKRLYTKQIFQH